MRRDEYSFVCNLWPGSVRQFFHNVCEMCDEWFNALSILTCHKVSVHEGLYFLCEMCDELFNE